VLGLSAAHCGGPTTSSIGSGVLAPPPPAASWSPSCLPIGWVSFADFSLPSMVIGPIDPPPRRSFSWS
jgi:hypothetical protein